MAEEVRILHVDDEPDFSDTAASFLESYDERFVVETAMDAEEGFDKVSRGGFDCVVSEYDIPNENGIEFLERVRAYDSTLPFILFTGKGSEEVASESISKEVTDYMQKEDGAGQFELLANKIAKAVGKHRSERRSEDGRSDLSLIADNSDDVLFMFDGHWSELLFVNPAYEDIWGDTVEELRENPSSFLDYIHPDDRDSGLESMEKIATGKVDEREYRVLPPDGQMLWIRGNTKPVFDEDGEVSRIVGYVRDITHEILRESELERAQDLLYRTEEIAEVGGWEIHPGSMETYWTENLFSILGVAEEEGATFDRGLDVLHPADRDRVEEALMEAMEDGERVSLEARYHRSGETRWLKIGAVPVIKDGEVSVLRGAVQDVTERKNRENTLQQMYKIIADRNITFEEKVESLLGVGRRELKTEYGTLSEIDGDDYIFDIVDGAHDSVKKGDVVPVEATNCEVVAEKEKTLVLGDVERDAPDQLHRSGFTDWGISSYIGAPVIVDDEVHGTFCFYGTEPRKGQFSEWERTLVDLMSKWVSTEMQRQRAQERVEKHNEQLERFTSIVSHDLRNPLNVVRGYIEMAQDSGDLEHLEPASSAVDRMESLIEKLLTMTKAGEDVGDLEEVKVEVLVEGCWRNVATMDARVDVTANQVVRADETRLRQLSENLFRNAVEHGGKEVEVSVGDLEDGFYVEDDGEGIPPEQRENVFEGGFSDSDEGIGLGLGIVQEIVDAHGWGIEVVESDSGGARFEVTGVDVVGS